MGFDSERRDGRGASAAEWAIKLNAGGAMATALVPAPGADRPTSVGLRRAFRDADGAARGGHGVRSMRERAASLGGMLTVARSEPKGTAVEVVLP
jgi:hypothetical protein